MRKVETISGNFPTNKECSCTKYHLGDNIVKVAFSFECHNIQVHPVALYITLGAMVCLLAPMKVESKLEYYVSPIFLTSAPGESLKS